MNSRKQDGFTLIEVLVAINLSFFVLTLAVSFYLFAAKFINSFNDRFEKNEASYEFINQLDGILKESNGFQIIVRESTNFDFLGLPKEIIFNKVFTLGEIYGLANIESYKFNLITDDNINYFISRTDSFDTGNFPDNFSVYSQEVRNFELRFVQNGKSYNYKYQNPSYSAARFINIRN